MNLNMVKPKYETGDLLLSITKNFETLFDQTHSKPRETVGLSLSNPEKLPHLNHLLFFVFILTG